MSKPLINPDTLDFLIQNGINFGLKGRHGTGKTSVIKQAFERNGLNYLYFSGSTMDPWTQFVGIPKEREREGKPSVIEMIMPEALQDDTVNAIFIDEFNRAEKEVRNAVMELIQFKSMHGKSFENLKIIAVAINPDDDDSLEYDVETLDPAQMDRIPVWIDVPYKPCKNYFSSAYGENVSKALIEWWSDLSDEGKMLISPRKLDDAAKIHCLGGDLKLVLPKQHANASELKRLLQSGSRLSQMEKILEDGDTQAASKFMRNVTNATFAVPHLSKDERFMKMFLPYMSEELIVSQINSGNEDIANHLIDNLTSRKKYLRVAQSVLDTNPNFKEKVSQIYPSSLKEPTSPKASQQTTTSLQLTNSLSFLDSYVANSHEPLHRVMPVVNSIIEQMAASSLTDAEKMDIEYVDNIITRLAKISNRLPRRLVSSSMEEFTSEEKMRRMELFHLNSAFSLCLADLRRMINNATGSDI